MNNTNQKAASDNDMDNMPENMTFETDVARLLDIVANALYSNRDVFLRELISNAADACDKLRYERIRDPQTYAGNNDLAIYLSADNNDLTLTVTDNGIGMNREELVENLGTIARSGTAAMIEAAKSQRSEKDDLNLIGQFGVGFYASFMVAQKVEVISRKAGEDQSWFWESDGRSGYTVREATDEEAKRLNGVCGTSICLFMKPDAIDYLLEDKIKQIVGTYSDHIEKPIYLLPKGEAELQEEAEPINAASALWTRPKNEITAEQYKEFYHHIGHGFDEPALTLHWRAEGKIEYTALLFIPTLRPWDLYDPERKNNLRLYVKRVFISDRLDQILYPWLRFVRGIVDTPDLPLNISREMLQSNPVLHKIRSGLTKKILMELKKLAESDNDAFLSIWGQFGAIFKEGLYDAVEHREAIFDICRFHSTADPEKPVSLADYMSRMKEGQNEIYYITGESAEALRNSPQLEGFKARGVEVLLMTDTVDEFWLQQVRDYQDKPFKSVTQGHIDLSVFDRNDTTDAESESEKAEEKKHDSAEMDTLRHNLQEKISEHVAYVRISKRLTDSPVCLVADDSGVDMHMEKVLKLHQNYQPTSKPVLEINPDHALIKKMATMSQVEGGEQSEYTLFDDMAYLLLDQARIIQGDGPVDPSAFARRMATFMESGLA